MKSEHSQNFSLSDIVWKKTTKRKGFQFFGHSHLRCRVPKSLVTLRSLSVDKNNTLCEQRLNQPITTGLCLYHDGSKEDVQLRMVMGSTVIFRDISLQY